MDSTSESRGGRFKMILSRLCREKSFVLYLRFLWFDLELEKLQYTTEQSKPISGTDFKIL